MVPPANGRLLAEAIRGARLHVQPGAGHLLFTDAPEVDAAVADFLSEPSARFE